MKTGVPTFTCWKSHSASEIRMDAAVGGRVADRGGVRGAVDADVRRGDPHPARLEWFPGPGGTGSESAAQSDGGGYHHGFRCIVTISKLPVGVGNAVWPVATPKVRISFTRRRGGACSSREGSRPQDRACSPRPAASAPRTRAGSVNGRRSSGRRGSRGAPTSLSSRRPSTDRVARTVVPRRDEARADGCPVELAAQALDVSSNPLTGDPDATGRRLPASRSGRG